MKKSFITSGPEDNHHGNYLCVPLFRYFTIVKNKDSAKKKIDKDKILLLLLHVKDICFFFL